MSTKVKDIIDLIKSNFDNNKISIYSNSDNNSFKNIINSLSYQLKQKIIICKYLAEDIQNENDLQIKISKENQNQCPGVIALYEHPKNKFYYDDIRLYINTLTNNFSVCSARKCDRNPIKPAFNKTELPENTNEIIHVDIYVNNKTAFIISLTNSGNSPQNKQNVQNKL